MSPKDGALRSRDAGVVVPDVPVARSGPLIVSAVLVLATVPDSVDLRAVVNAVRSVVETGGCTTPVVELVRTSDEDDLIDVRGWCKQEPGDGGH